MAVPLLKALACFIVAGVALYGYFLLREREKEELK